MGKVWTNLEMYFEALTGRKELKGCISIKDVTAHSHLNSDFSNLGREWRKEILKNPNDLWATRFESPKRL